MTLPAPPIFDDDDAYERSLTDGPFWAPYAKAALRQVGFSDEGEVVTYFPTTHVAALVDDRYLVKLHYEEWFGEDCFQTEREAYAMLAGRELPIPELLAEGALYDNGEAWRWPFLVMTAMRGRSMREHGSHLTDAERARAAAFIGETLRELHKTPITDGEYVSFEMYADLIQTRTARCHRDHETWGSLPAHLVDQVRDYVRESRDLIDPERRPAKLLHGDLHDGNVFLDGEPGATAPTGIVDFNDVQEGDPHYDLVAVHLKALGADKGLLKIVLDAYGWGELGKRWPRRMMALTLAHDYDMIRPAVERSSAAVAETETLDDLATLLWDLDAPSLL